MSKQPKPKKCRICKTEFKPFSSTQVVCGVQCAIAYQKRRTETQAKAEAKIERKELRERKNKMKSRGDWLTDAQKDCNAYIRGRDYGNVCISCQKPPKKKNAGHYLSVGSHPELRFHPFNINLQCEHCNTYKSGNQAAYRVNLIDKIGLSNVEWLEGPHDAQHWSIEDIKEIKGHYKEQAKLLKS